MYQVKNIDNPNWKNHRFTVIRDNRDESNSEMNGWWYFGSFDSLQLAQEKIRELGGKSWIVPTEDVEEVK